MIVYGASGSIIPNLQVLTLIKKLLVIVLFKQGEPVAHLALKTG